MSKKLITACMALVALAALVGPATASANNTPTLVDSGGALPVGAKITGTNVNQTTFITTSGGGLVHCTNAKMTGEVVKNSGGTVEGTISKSEFSGTGTVAHNGLPECTGSFGNAWITVVNSHLCIRSTPAMNTDEFQVSGGNCPGGEKVKFIIGSTSIGECEYESTGAVKGDHTTGSEDSTLTTRNTSAGSGASKIRGGFLCPASGALQMTFTLETDETNNTVWITHAP